MATAAEAAAGAAAAAAAADDGAVGGSLVLGPWWGDRTGKGQADPPPPNRRQRRTLTRCGTARAGGARGDPRAAHRRPLSLSWSRWYQAIVLADQGHEQGARGKNYEAPVRTPGSTSSNTWRWADVNTSSFDASWTSTRSGSVNQPLSEPWHRLCSQSSRCERTIRVTGPAARRLLGRRRDVTQQKRLRHNNIRAGAEHSSAPR